MSDNYPEALVIVSDAARYQNVLDLLRQTVRVTHMLPPRLAVVAGLAGRGGSHPEVAGVTWYSGAVPRAVLDRLSPPELLFAAAWNTRRTGKERPGDRLPWDAPGHLPPDLPRK